MTAYLTAFALPVVLWPLRERRRLLYLVLLTAAWTLFAGLRQGIGGLDYFAYQAYYTTTHGTWEGLWEPMFKGLNGLCRWAGLPWQGFLIVTAALAIVPAVLVIDKHSEATPIGLVVYAVEIMLYGSFVILRQGIAMGLGFVVIDLVRRRKFFPAMVFALLAAGFHYSALLLLLYIPLSLRMPRSLRTLIWILAGAAGAGTVLLVLSGAINKLGGPLANRIIIYVRYIGGATLNPLNILELLGIGYLFSRYGKSQPELYRNAFLMVLLFALLATLEAIFVRMGSYFKLVLPLAYPLLARAEPESRVERRLGPGWIQGAIFLYYLAKISRWLLVNAGGSGGFLPYRAGWGG